ncbi:MAG: hypothetical protein KJ624_06080 [Chloroflexi bacterium]|nr:hypothetical protein [Chloroflexota bacterium]
MRKVGFLLVLLVLLVLAACGQGRAPVAPTRTPTSAAPGVTASVPALSLVVTAPPDEVVVKDAVLRVLGRTSPDAVVSVDGKIVRTVDMEGNFSALVSLVEGPNLLEVIATDYRGGQASQVLTVIYAPQG